MHSLNHDRLESVCLRLGDDVLALRREYSAAKLRLVTAQESLERELDEYAPGFDSPHRIAALTADIERESAEVARISTAIRHLCEHVAELCGTPREVA